MPSISVVVIQYGDSSLLVSLFRSIQDHPDEKLIDEIVVVNNGDPIPNGCIDQLEQKIPSIEKLFIKNPNESYSSGVNMGVKEAAGDIIIISNNDIELVKGETLRPLINNLIQKEVAIVGPQLINIDGSWQQSFGRFHTIKSSIESLLMINNLKSKYWEYKDRKYNGLFIIDGYVSGAFIVTTKNIFESLDGFDERFKFYAEDADFSFRAKHSGYQVGINNKCKVKHSGGEASDDVYLLDKKRVMFESRKRFLQKHHNKTHSYVYASVHLTNSLLKCLLFLFLFKVTKNHMWKNKSIEMKSIFKAIILNTIDRI